MSITLKAARINKNLTQKQAAELLGVQPETVGNWERQKSFPDVRMIRKIEEVYSVSYNDIIFLPDNVD